MCRFVYYRGEPIKLSALITEPAHSIIHQSYHSKEREEPLNGDGFGIAWYAPSESDKPAIFKDVTPAWNNHNLEQLAGVIRSSCIIAHVRAATPGLPVTQLNCHPFSWQSFSFAHNGEVAGFSTMRRQIQSRLSQEAYDLLQGSTDSEHLFALFVDRYLQYQQQSKLEAMAAALQDTISIVEMLREENGIQEVSRLNLVLTDGELTAITRFVSPGEQDPHSLYVHSGAAYECHGGVCHMRERSESGKTVLVASEPLSKDYGWRPIPANTMLIIDGESQVLERPISAWSGTLM